MAAPAGAAAEPLPVFAVPDSPALDALLADFDCGDWSDLPTDPGPPPAAWPVPADPDDSAEPDPADLVGLDAPGTAGPADAALGVRAAAHRAAYRAAYGPLARLVGPAYSGDRLARYEGLWRDRLRALARAEIGPRMVLTPVSLEYALRCGATGRRPTAGKPVPCGRWFCPHCRYRLVRDVWLATAAAAETPGAGLWVDDRRGPAGPADVLRPFVDPPPGFRPQTQVAGPRPDARLLRADTPAGALAAFVGRGPYWDGRHGWRYRWTAAGLTEPPARPRPGRPTPASRPGPAPGPRPATVPATPAGWADALAAAWGWPAWLLRAPVDEAAEVLELWWNTRMTSRTGRLVRKPDARLIDANEPASVGNSGA